jgi:transcriptional repressor NrdR
MKCYFCGFVESKVIDSRATEEGESIRRRRECMRCKKRFTTYEKVESVPLLVIKKDKSRQIFSREKLLAGIMRACETRPVSITKAQHIVDEIENAMYNAPQHELQSVDIGMRVMERLKTLDEVAYVRFSSVYYQFNDVQTFMDELSKLINEKKRQL